jgi:hypothetical protein
MNKQRGLMSKQCVLISIRPQWCAKIANGEKTIEVRKTRPKMETPFKCYIYCTNDKENTLFKDWIDPPFVTKEYNIMRRKGVKNVFADNRPWDNANGKIIGEFVCDNIKAYFWDDFIGAEDLDGTIREKAVAGEGTYWIQESECLAMCLSLYNEILPYGNGKTLYGWHISALQIYDKPRELSEFHKPEMPTGLRYEDDTIKRQPQSWAYVEEYDGKH